VGQRILDFGTLRGFVDHRNSANLLVRPGRFALSSGIAAYRRAAIGWVRPQVSSSNPAHEEIKHNVSVVAAESGRTLKFQYDRDQCSLPDNHTVSFHCEF
jgi:hypothetical protein